MSQPMSASQTCTMPEHGSPTAPSACCRPKPVAAPPGESVTTAKPTHQAAGATHFWADQKIWWAASRNTLNCLIGCSIGDFGVIIYAQVFHPGWSMMTIMVLAMAAGLLTSMMLETVMLRWREGFAWRQALVTAFSMSFLSMLGMELAANLTDFMLTGGRLPLSEPFYWVALAISMGAGFLAPLPYNYYQLKRHGRSCH
jgi:hypothetical protein